MVKRLAALVAISRHPFGSLSLPRVTTGLLLATALTVSHAQTITSSLTGTITDPTSSAVPGALVRAEGIDVVAKRSVTTDAHGVYTLAALPAGSYRVSVTRPGFSEEVVKAVNLTLDRTVTLNLKLKVGSVAEVVEVTGESQLIDITTPATGLTITPEEIHDIPLNGRNYLDLLQLVPGTTINHQNDPGSDTAISILGERGNNTGYLIDGLNNSNELTGGPFSQFNMDTIGEFEVLTSGYKAEFGHASGGIVNVITKTGTNDIHGLASVFLRDNKLDTSDIPGTPAPSLLRWDYDLALGGPVVKNKVFWFASGENIHQNAALNYTIPAGTPPVLVASENAYGGPSRDHEARLFGKLSEVLGRQSLRQELNYTNVHISNDLPLSLSTNLPSSRQNSGLTALMIGGADTVLLGAQDNPTILNLYAQYQNEPSTSGPAHPQAGPYTSFYIFSGFNTGGVVGDQGLATFGSLSTQGLLKQHYGDAGFSVQKNWKRNTFKFGYDYMRTQVDGVEAAVQANQLFATAADFATYGPVNAGFSILYDQTGTTLGDNNIALRNNYSGAYLQDDIKLSSKLVVNAGLRWDYDSEFKKTTNFSPRVGFSYAPTDKTILRGSFGVFYDHFRLGVARDVPGFGGANLAAVNPLVYPRLFYGIPTVVPALFGLCLSPTKTDAQLASQAATCQSPYVPPTAPAIYGVDHLNNVVAAGHSPIPGNSVVTQSNIQALSGLDPSAYLAQAAVAVGQAPGFFYWGPTGALSQLVNPASSVPVTIDPSFSTPFSRSYTLGIQQQIARDFVFAIDGYHKDIRNILGVRQTNIPFNARVTNTFFNQPVNGYGPWFSGKYNALVVSLEKRFSHHYAVGGSYSWTSENDDATCANLDQGSAQVGSCYPTDSFVGQTTLVTDPKTGQTNANNGFFLSNGNFAPKANTFWNGPKLDEGPSAFALRHTFQMHGTVHIPFKIELSSIVRAQSGFRYTQSATAAVDQDGNGQISPRDLKTGRNTFTAPPYFNQDLRIARTFTIHDHLKIEPLFEYFNLYNNANPAAIQVQQALGKQFGTISQRLPGRQGEAALRIEF